MKPIDVERHPKKVWMIIHRCIKCGHVQKNKAAFNDEQPDNLNTFIKLM